MNNLIIEDYNNNNNKNERLSVHFILKLIYIIFLLFL